jgi:exosortase A
MSAYLIWQKRDLWMRAAVKPSIVGFLFLLMSIAIWLVASLVSVQLASQLAVIAMFGTVIWSILGPDISRVIRFPLLFAFLAVPFGEFLIPPMMNWTAYFAVWALQITGIPVIREGLYFSLPSGNFEVIEACSGIRFLLVTVVLGLYFAHSTYNSWTKRGIFLALTGITVIIANWLRAYLVVLTAHYTDMKFGQGQSHIYLGWVLFLVVIALVFWFGRRYEDIGDDPMLSSNEIAKSWVKAKGQQLSDVIIASTVTLIVILSGPSLLDFGRERLSAGIPCPHLPVAKGDWLGPQSVGFGYRPVFVGASNVLEGRYSHGGQVVEIFSVVYSNQQQGSELIGWKNQLFDASVWRELKREKISPIRLPGAARISAQSVLITNNKQRLLLWYWYDIGGTITLSAEAAKIRQAWNMVAGRGKGDALLVLATPVTDRDITDMSKPIEQFLRDNFAGMTNCLRPKVNEDLECVF